MRLAVVAKIVVLLAVIVTSLWFQHALLGVEDNVVFFEAGVVAGMVLGAHALYKWCLRWCRRPPT